MQPLRLPPRLGIVLPVRNGAAFLRDALDSLFGQTFADFELVVVDDGSTDATPKILGAFADPRLRVLANRGAGLVDALSTGLAATAAPLVARMDADDIALPSRLERQIAFLDANPGVALVGAQVAHMDAGGRPTGHVSSFPTAPARIAEALMTRGCVLRHPTVMARRPALDAVGAYRRVVEGAEDYDLWLRLSERAALANLPDVLLRYRIHDAQVSHGINWRQRFAHDLALVAARARRRGEPDPLDGLDAPLAYRDPAARQDPRLSPALRSLALAYAAAEAMTADAAATPDAQALRAMIDTTRHALFGDGRRTRARMMARATRAALRGRRWSLALQSARLAFEAAPGRAVGWMLARG